MICKYATLAVLYGEYGTAFYFGKKWKGGYLMEFFGNAVDGLVLVVTAIGGGLGVWGVINLLEGYGNDNAASKSQGIKQLMSGGGIIIIAQTVIPLLKNLFTVAS